MSSCECKWDTDICLEHINIVGGVIVEVIEISSFRGCSSKAEAETKSGCLLRINAFERKGRKWIGQRKKELQCRLKMPWSIWWRALKQILPDRVALHQTKMVVPSCTSTSFSHWCGLLKEGVTLGDKIPERDDSWRLSAYLNQHFWVLPSLKGNLSNTSLYQPQMRKKEVKG